MQCYTYTAWNWLNAVTDSGRLKHSKSEKRQMWRRPRAECSVPSAEGPKMVTTAAVLRDWTASQASAHTWQLPPATAPGPARGWVWSHPGWEGTPETGKAGHQLKTRMGAPVWASKPSELCARWRPSPHRWTCNSHSQIFRIHSAHIYEEQVCRLVIPSITQHVAFPASVRDGGGERIKKPPNVPIFI